MCVCADELKTAKQLTLNFIDMMYYVIEGKNKVFATYNKTICYEANMNEENRSEILTEAKATVFNYAVDMVNVHLGIVYEPNIENSNDVFNFLDKNIAD